MGVVPVSVVAVIAAHSVRPESVVEAARLDVAGLVRAVVQVAAVGYELGAVPLSHLRIANVIFTEVFGKQGREDLDRVLVLEFSPVPFFRIITKVVAVSMQVREPLDEL